MAESVIGSAARSLRRSRLASPRNAKLRASCRSVTSSIPLVALSLGRAEAANSLIASNTQPGGANTRTALRIGILPGSAAWPQGSVGLQ